MTRFRSLLVAAAVCCWGLLACKSGPRGAAGPNAAGASSGEASYLQLCAPCHGKDAKGYAADHAPSLVNPTFLESASDDFLKQSIARGRPGTSMGAYGKSLGGPLDDAALDRVAAYLRSLGPAPTARLASGGSGNAARGAALYATNCKSCHGDTVARGEAVQLMNATFLEMAPDPFLRHAILRGRPGTKMEPFAAKLSEAQVDDLVAYLRQRTVPEPEKLLPEPTGKEPLVLNPKGEDPQFTAREDRFVPADQVKKALDEKRRLIIVDARPPSDWRRVHVKGAVSIPYHDMTRLAEVPKNTWVVAYCACPHHLSGNVVDELRRRGHVRSVILDEGINEWHRRGYPVVAAEGVLPPAAEPPPANH